MSKRPELHSGALDSDAVLTVEVLDRLRIIQWDLIKARDATHGGDWEVVATAMSRMQWDLARLRLMLPTSLHTKADKANK